MTTNRICFDIDNVVAQTDKVMRKIIREFTGGRVALDYENAMEFDYFQCKDSNSNSITKDEWFKIHEIFSEPENLLEIEPFPNVQKYLLKLAEKFEIHLVTSRLPKARRTTIEWLDVHSFPPHNLHFLDHNEKHKCLVGFIGVVEDNYEQAKAFAEVGIKSYLIKHPWNASKPPFPNLCWVDGWPELVERLMARSN